MTPNFAVNLSQRFIINPTKEINFEPWGIGGLNRGRSETGIRFSISSESRRIAAVDAAT